MDGLKEQDVMITNLADRSMVLMTFEQYESIKEVVEADKPFLADLKAGKRHILAGYTKPFIFTYNN